VTAAHLHELSHADLLATLSLATDLGVGLPAEHGLRACYIGLSIADEAGIARGAQGDVCQALLLKDAGCTSWSTQIAAFIHGDEIAARREMLFERQVGSPRDVLSWALRHMAADAPWPSRASSVADFMVHGRDFMREGFLNAGEAARRIAERLGANQQVQEALPALFEQWNGAGMPLGLRGDAIPVLSRIVALSSYVEVAHRTGGRAAARRIVRERTGSAFDPTLVRAFESVAERESFWTPVESSEVWPVVAAHAPTTTIGVDDFARCCADFVDMKAYWLAGHSRRVADLAQRIAARLGLAESDQEDVMLAGLVHDLGLVPVPSFILNKPDEDRTSQERSAVEAHCQVVRDLLGRNSDLRSVAEMAALHHAELDEHAPVGAVAVALANEFDVLTHFGPGRPALALDVALARMESAGRARSLPSAWTALLDAVGARASVRAPRRGWPRGLTDREVEVLRCLTEGLSRRETAARLVVSESTVRTHLEHIYEKLEVSTRVGAVLFAFENDLIR